MPMSQIITVTPTEEGKGYWLHQGLAKDHFAQIESADVLIVPEKDFCQGVPFVFHQDTAALFKYLRTNLEDSTSVEVCASDEEYMEIALHSATHRFSTIITTYVAAPLIVGLLTNYLYDNLKAKPTDNVEVALVVEDHECKAFKFEFTGKAEDFGLLADKVGELARNCKATDGESDARDSK